MPAELRQVGKNSVPAGWGRERCPAALPTREDLLLFRRTASPQQLLSALEPALLTPGPGAVAGVSPLPCAEGACARTMHGCTRARAPRGGASQESLRLDQARLGKGAPLRPWDRWRGRGGGTQGLPSGPSPNRERPAPAQGSWRRPLTPWGLSRLPFTPLPRTFAYTLGTMGRLLEV